MPLVADISLEIMDHNTIKSEICIHLQVFVIVVVDVDVVVVVDGIQ